MLVSKVWKDTDTIKRKIPDSAAIPMTASEGGALGWSLGRNSYGTITGSHGGGVEL